MTPLMKQYNEMKKKHPDAILLFRVGDFYETFKQDAEDCYKILGITLTRRHTPEGSMKLAGFPRHALDTYLPRLVRAGRRIAICEQLENQKLTKKQVKRGITELITSNTEPSRPICDFKVLSDAIGEVIILLSTYVDLSRKFKEFKELAISMKVSPKRAFE